MFFLMCKDNCYIEELSFVDQGSAHTDKCYVLYTLETSENLPTSPFVDVSWVGSVTPVLGIFER